MPSSVLRIRIRSLLTLMAAALVGGALVAATPASHAHTIHSADAEDPPRLYVTNQGEASVSIINMDTHEVETTVDLTELGFSENAQPHHAIAEPDGSAWYVSLIGDNTVLQFNADNEIISQGSMQAPGLLSLHADNDQLFIARSMMAVSPPQSLGMAPRSDLGLLEEVDVFIDRPHALATTPDGRFVYSASLATNQFIGVDPTTRRGELSTIDGDTHVIVQMAASPITNEIVGTGQTTAQLLFFDIEDDGTLTHTESVEVGAQPWHPVYSDDGERIFVPNKQSNDISVVDATERRVVDTITHDSFAEPHGAVLSPDGTRLYISNNHQRAMMEDMARDMGMDPDAHDDHADHDDHEHHDEHDDHEHHDEHDEHVHHDEHDAHHDDEGHDHTTEDRPGTITVIDTETLEVVDVIEVGVYPTGIGTYTVR